MTNSPVSRRAFLGGSVAAAGLAALGLAGCSGGSGGGATGGTAGTGATAFTLPTYRAFPGATPDLAGTAEGVFDAFTTFPTSRLTSVDGKPGDGSTLTALVPTFSTPPAAMSGNSFWRNLNDRLGLTLDVTVTPGDGYIQKVQTTVAGGDLPDMMCFGSPFPIPDTVALLEARFTHLNEYLCGDAVLEYPNLANIPTPSWQQIVLGDAIWGIPLPRGVVGDTTYVRWDILAALGITEAPVTLEEYFDAMVEVTDAKSLRWGMTDPEGTVRGALLALKAPNRWSLAGDTFAHEIQSEEFVEALEFARRSWEAGIIHPDGVAQNGQTRSWFYSGQIVSRYDGFSGWRGLVENGLAEGGTGASDYQVKPLLLSESGDPTLNKARASFGWGAIRQGDEAHVRRCLALANYLAAPFATEEWLTINYGVENSTYALTDAGPEITELGKAERGLGLSYLAGPPETLFVPKVPGLVEEQHAYMAKVVPTIVQDATEGLFSETWLSRTAGLTKIVTDGINDVVMGRSDVTSWRSSVVPSWLSAGGQQAIDEFTAARDAVA